MSLINVNIIVMDIKVHCLSAVLLLPNEYLGKFN